MDCYECRRPHSRRRQRPQRTLVVFYLSLATILQQPQGCQADDRPLLRREALSFSSSSQASRYGKEDTAYRNYYQSQTFPSIFNSQKIEFRRKRRRRVQTNETDSNGDEEVIRIENSTSFQVFFAALVGFIFLVRAVVCGLLIRYREHGNLRLAQPYVLAVLIFSGSVSIVGCYFLIHKEDRMGDTLSGDISCILRDPLILLPLTFAGNILLGRVWRIVLLLTPVLNVGRGQSIHDAEEDYTCGIRSKDVLLYYLTRVADFYYWIDWVQSKLCGEQRKTLRKTSTALRKQVPLQQLFLLTTVLTFPQLLLQILNLSVPAMQATLTVQEKPLFDNVTAELLFCEADTGRWPIYLGSSLAFIPYLMTAVIAWNSQDDLPKIFNEAAAYTRCSKVILLVLVIVIPPLIMTGANDPDTEVYMTAILVFAFTMPPCWFLVYPKLWQVIMEDKENNAASSKSNVHRLLRKKQSNRNFLPANTREDNGKSAKLALTIGKMYEDMGMTQKCIDLFDEALAVWECDPGRDHKDKVGGFTVDEIDSFSVHDLEHIVQLLIAKGRVNGTFQVTDNSGQKNAAQAWLDALEIYEKAPARASMTDRSMLFPIFSGLFVFLKGGKIQQDAKCNFEQNLARKFVRETKLQGDPVHYSRALAMFCEVKARLGKYKIALDTFETLKQIYDPEEHSEAVSSAYGTDRSAQAFSQTALWHLQLGDEAKALEACEYVLDDLMPLMDPKNVLNMCEMLLPIIYVYKTRGQEKRMKDLFDKYVIHNFHVHFKGKGKSTPCEPVFKPMTMLLEICHDPSGFSDLPEAVEWLIDEDNGVPSDFLDSVYTKLCWSMLSLTAELCLRVAKRLIAVNGNVSDTERLMLKGLKLAKKAEQKMTNHRGKVILPIAYALHEPIYSELKELADSMGIESTDDMNSIQNVSQKDSQSSMAEAKNLPASYLKSNGLSSGTSLDSKTQSSDDNVVHPNATTMAHFVSRDTTDSSGGSHGEQISVGSTSMTSKLESHAEEPGEAAGGRGVEVA